MMRIIWIGGWLLLCAMDLFVPFSVHAEPSFWVNPHMICGKTCFGQLEGGFSLNLDERVGLYGFAQNITARGTKPFQQAYGGLSLNAGDGFEVGGGVGADNESNIIKNGWIAYNNGVIAFFATAERGGLAYNKLMVSHRLGDFHLGVMYDTPFGWGICAEKKLNKNIRPWVGILRRSVGLGAQVDF